MPDPNPKPNPNPNPKPTPSCQDLDPRKAELLRQAQARVLMKRQKAVEDGVMEAGATSGGRRGSNATEAENTDSDAPTTARRGSLNDENKPAWQATTTHYLRFKLKQNPT